MKSVWKKLFCAASAIVMWQNSTVLAAAANTMTIVEIPYASCLTDTNSSIRIILHNTEQVSVKIEKKTQEGSDLYYDCVLEPEKSGIISYVFFLDYCEYNIYNETYVSSYVLTIDDDVITAETEPLYQEENMIVVDPNFSQSGKACIGSYDVTTEEEGITVQKVTLGDMDANQIIDVEDVCMVLDYYAKTSAALSAEISLTTADVNGDGIVDMTDAIGILTYYARASAGLEPDFE